MINARIGLIMFSIPIVDIGIIITVRLCDLNIHLMLTLQLDDGTFFQVESFSLLILKLNAERRKSYLLAN